ncbi:Mitochondrial fission protein, partial [Ascosphaera atra]
MAPPRADAQSGKPDKTGRAQANPDVTVEAPPDISGDEENVSDFDEDAALAFEEPSSGGGLLASSGLTFLLVRNLEAFSRKVTTTANHLMSARNNSPALPLSEGYASPSTSRRRDTSKNRSTSQSRSRRTQSGALTRSNNKTNHSDPYQDALRHIHSEIRKSPALQRRVFSFARTTPTELVRSKLSTSEIQSRALCSVPDELLVNIPEDTSTYSLFQGFQASVETAGGKEGGTGTDGAESEIRRARRRRLEWGKLLESGDAEGEDGKDAKAKGKKTREALAELSKDRDKLAHRLDIMGVRKNMCSSEIKELDQKIMNLHRMRDIVLERLAGLEMDEQDLEYELTQLDNKLEDLEDEVELIDEAAKDEADANAPADSSQADQQDGFMSQSVYEKLPSAAEESGNNKTPSRSRAS